MVCAKAVRAILQTAMSCIWSAAWKMGKKFADKTDISFTDFTSFIIMKELRISEALTADRYFEQVGMGFSKLF
jgi:predicted nucleic acid-binding protein